MKMSARCLVVLVGVLGSAVALAQGTAPAAADPGKDLTAEQIVTTAYERYGQAYANIKANLKMTITTAKGEVKARDLELRGIRPADGMVRTVVKFRSPADVAGTAFLVIQNKSGPPEQYLYLPNLKKVRRIASGQASQSFMGSDFTFLDMSPVPAAGASEVTYDRLPDGTVGGQAVYVAEVKPKAQGAPYSRVVVHVQKETMTPIKIEFFDATGAALKELKVKKMKKLKGADGKDRMVPLETEMRNVQKGSTTQLTLEDVDLETKLAEGDFTPSSLEQ